MILYNKLKEACKYMNYRFKEDMIQDLWLKLKTKNPNADDLPVYYLVVCCKNYIRDAWKSSTDTWKLWDSKFSESLETDIVDNQEDNEFDTLYKNSKYKDLIDKFLECKTWYKFGKEIKMSDKTAKKFLIKILKDEQQW